MAPSIDKHALLEMLRRRLAERLAGLTSTQRSAQSGATHAEAKQEHPKDTRAIEAQYLARGLAQRVETLRDDVGALNTFVLRDLADGDTITSGALVGLRDDEDRELTYFLLPAGAGERLDIEGAAVLVVTPQSPLGRSLLGARADDQIEVELPGGKRTVEIAWLR